MCCLSDCTSCYSYMFCCLDLLNSIYRVETFCLLVYLIWFMTSSLVLFFIAPFYCLYRPFYCFIVLDCSIYFCALSSSSVNEYTCSFSSSIIISCSSIILLHLAICSLNSLTVLSYLIIKFSYLIATCFSSESWEDVDLCNLYIFYFKVLFSFYAYFIVCDLSSLIESIFWFKLLIIISI